MPSLGWITRETVTDDGVRLRYKVAGSGDLAVILMHGWGSTRNYFDPTIECLELAGLKIVAFDLRGHGESDNAAFGYDPQRLARDMLHVADAAGADRFVSVGHSMGAKFIQCLPMVAPKRVLGQVLIAGTPAKAIPVEEALLDEWAGYAGDRDALRRSHHSIITRPVRHEITERWVAEAAMIPRDVLRRTLEVCFKADLAAEIGDASMPPTLAVGGSGDPFFSPDFLREHMVRGLPGARFVVLECGHEIPLEQPAELAGLMAAFVAGCTPTSARMKASN